VEIVDRTRVHLQLDALAGRRGLPLPVLVVADAAAAAAVLPACRLPVHVVFHDGAERIFARHFLKRPGVPLPVPVVPAVGAASAPVTGRRGLHRGHHVVGRGRRGTITALAALHNHHLDERHHRVAYLAHLPGQFKLLEQAHVAVALERRVLVAEREQLRHAQRVIVAEQSGQLAVRLGQRLQLHVKNDIIIRQLRAPDALQLQSTDTF